MAECAHPPTRPRIPWRAGAFVRRRASTTQATRHRIHRIRSWQQPPVRSRQGNVQRRPQKSSMPWFHLGACRHDLFSVSAPSTSFPVDVPSQCPQPDENRFWWTCRAWCCQRRAWRTSTSTYQQSFLVDVPSQRLHRIAVMEAVVHVHQICLQNRVWWTCRDLNSGPLPCQGSDLPTDLHAQMGAYAARPPEPPT